jgi:hypothetical protein
MQTLHLRDYRQSPSSSQQQERDPSHEVQRLDGNQTVLRYWRVRPSGAHLNIPAPHNLRGSHLSHPKKIRGRADSLLHREGL